MYVSTRRLLRPSERRIVFSDTESIANITVFLSSRMNICSSPRPVVLNTTEFVMEFGVEYLMPRCSYNVLQHRLSDRLLQ